MSKNNNELNGVSQVELIENKDYFEMKDGTWYTIEGAAKKYGIATTTVSWKGNQFDIAKKKIAGSLCYKEDERFTYQKAKPSNADHLPKNPTYSELVHRVTESIEKQETIFNWFDTFGKWITNNNNNQDKIIKYVEQIGHQVQENGNKLDMILDYLTKDKGVSNE